MTEKEHQEATARFDNLLALVERLRDPARGCPWDIRQTMQDVARYLLDETYEVLDALGKDSRRTDYQRRSTGRETELSLDIFTRSGRRADR